MFRCRSVSSALMILAVLAGNFAAARQGCCQWGPLASQCCCQRPAARCPHCCSASVNRNACKSASQGALSKRCGCRMHETAAAVIEPTPRYKEALTDALHFSCVSPETHFSSVVRLTARSPAYLHPPRHSLAAWHCSWQA